MCCPDLELVIVLLLCRRPFPPSVSIGFGARTVLGTEILSTRVRRERGERGKGARNYPNNQNPWPIESELGSKSGQVSSRVQNGPNLPLLYRVLYPSRLDLRHRIP